MRALSQSEYGEIRSLYESIYTPQVDEELELSDEELTEAVEDAVSELIEEGYDIDDIEDAFDDELIEEILDEAKVTMGKGGRVPLSRDAGKGPGVTSGSGSRMAAASRLDARKKEKRAETVKKTKKSIRDVIDKPAREYAAKRKIVPSKSGKNKLNIGNLEGKQRTSAGRREIRGRVAGDIVSRAKGKLDRGVKKVTDTAKGVKAGAQIAGSIAKDEARRAGRKAQLAGGKAVTAVKNAPEKAGSAARKGLKGLIRRGAEKVASGASKVAKRMSEEVETYDVVVEFLCDYGIAEDIQEAQWLMVNEIDSEDIESILEAYGLDEARGTIVSVKGGGKTKYTASSKDQRVAVKSAATRASSTQRKRVGKDIANTARVEQARKKSIENMNSKPGEDSGDYDAGYYGDDDTSDGKRHYSLSHTNRDARRRRASGR